MRAAIHSGNVVIDEDHEQLSQLIGEAVDLWMSKVPAADFDVKLRQIHDMLLEHFHIEETILRASHYDGIRQHHLVHEDISSRINDLMLKLYGNEENISRFNVIDQLEAILFDHEMVEDSDYISHLVRDDGKLIIDWQNKFDTGIADLDRRHRDLVSIYNRLAGCILRKMDKEDVLDVMVELYDFTVMNFPLEEEVVFLNLDSGSLARHRKYHKELINRIDDIVIKYVANDANAKLAIGGYLRYLLIDHLETGAAEIITTA
jgi:hemerythrin